MNCAANPGSFDGHTHGVTSLDTLTGNGWTNPGGPDGHTHRIVNWEALTGPGVGHTHHVTCDYDPGITGGGGAGSGY